MQGLGIVVKCCCAHFKVLIFNIPKNKNTEPKRS